MKLEVGKSYRNGLGNKVTIKERSTCSKPYPLIGDDGKTYTPEGGYSLYTPSRIDLVAEWIDPNQHNPYGEDNHPLPPKKEEQPPRKWAELTDYEKGSLLLAHQKGKEVQFYRRVLKCWETTPTPNWFSDHAYRIKPEVVVEKKRGTMVFHDGVMVEGSWRSEEDIYNSEE